MNIKLIKFFIVFFMDGKHKFYRSYGMKCNKLKAIIN